MQNRKSSLDWQRWTKIDESKDYLMSPSFLLIAEPTVEKAAEVFCPAWDSVSWVFLYLWEEKDR